MRFFFLLAVVCAASGFRLPGVIKSKKPQYKLWGQERIVGGEEATYGEFPHQISLQGFGSHMCGGSIYNNEWVITAGHCCDGMSHGDLKVKYGMHHLHEHDEFQGNDKVKKIKMHPDYDSWTITNDICLLHLTKPLEFNDHVNKIALPVAGKEEEAGSVCTVSGWGTTSEGGHLASVLMKVDVPVVSDEDCRASYGENDVADSMICAGLDEGGKDSCQGDSGGPFMCGGELTGIVSWGQGCAEPGYPGVYTQVSYFVDWVVATAGEA